MERKDEKDTERERRKKTQDLMVFILYFRQATHVRPRPSLIVFDTYIWNRNVRVRRWALFLFSSRLRYSSHYTSPFPGRIIIPYVPSS